MLYITLLISIFSENNASITQIAHFQKLLQQLSKTRNYKQLIIQHNIELSSMHHQGYQQLGYILRTLENTVAIYK